jgi:hypothetical protein
VVRPPPGDTLVVSLSEAALIGDMVAEMGVVEIGRDERGPYAVANAWLWVDGMRI